MHSKQNFHRVSVFDKTNNFKANIGSFSGNLVSHDLSIFTKK